MGIGPNFTATIPIPPGLSGAPVFGRFEDDELHLVGVASADSSPGDAFNDTRIAGAGRVACIESVLSLPISQRTQRPIGDLYLGEPIEIDLTGPDA